MLYYYNELLKSGLTRYEIEKKVRLKELYKITNGIYSDEAEPHELEVIIKKFSNIALTLNSAFFYHNLTDKIPEFYYIATDRDENKINHEEVKQIFTKKEYLNIGVTTISVDNINAPIYDKERMLIELVRYKTKLSYELYKEVINNYRKIKNELDFIKLHKYAKVFNKPFIMETIEKEII